MVPPTLSYTDYDYNIIQFKSEVFNVRTLKIFVLISQKMSCNCEILWVSHWFLLDISLYFHKQVSHSSLYNLDPYLSGLHIL